MNTRPVVAATLACTEDGVPYAVRPDGVARPGTGTFAQARDVFLGGNELPHRWRGRARFVVLDTGFGLGSSFLATWQAWRDDPHRCERLVFLSIERNPLSVDDMRRAHARSPAPPLANALIDTWPLHTANLHTLEFEGGRVRLLLAFGEVQAWLPEWVAEVDAFFLDGFAPARSPGLWEPHRLKALARMAAPGATLATPTDSPALRDGLRAAGFEVRELATGVRANANATGVDDPPVTLARYAPRFTPLRAPSRQPASPHHRHALIVGAGLAGCATAQALAAEGWSCTVYDRRPGAAEETSGNPAGLFHGIVNAQDGIHARFNRAAALLAQRAIGAAIAHEGVAGAVAGVLRLDSTGLSGMSRTLHRLGLPAGYVRAVDAAQAGALSGLPLRQAAWYYPGGGWAHPAGLAQAWLRAASPRAVFRGGVHVARLQHGAGRWRLLDGAGHTLDEAEVVVLTNARDTLRLLGDPGWPVEAVRGQVSFFERRHAPGIALPRIPVAGAGYVLPEIAGRVVFGASAQPGDEDPAVRDSDGAANLGQLVAMLRTDPGVPPAALEGRVGWRTTAQDRLPIIGAMPDLQHTDGRLDQPRLVPRLPGLYVFTALASRGMAWAPLGARTLAAWVTGAPVPLEASLLDAVDPARFVSRQARRQASHAAARTPLDG